VNHKVIWLLDLRIYSTPNLISEGCYIYYLIINYKEFGDSKYFINLYIAAKSNKFELKFSSIKLIGS